MSFLRGRPRHAWKVAKRSAIYAFVRPVIEVFRILPPGPAAALGIRVGGLLAACAPGEVRRAADRLRRAFPDASEPARRRIARSLFRNLGRMLGEYLSLTRRDPARLAAAVTIEGFESVERALRARRGVVVLTAHLGSWEMAAAAVSLRVGGRLGVLARDLYDPRLTRLVSRLRAHFGIRTYDTGDARGVLGLLKEGGVLGVLIDQASPRVANVPSPFFGSPVATPVGPVKLAHRTGASLVMGFIRRTPAGGHHLVLEPLAEPQNGTPPETQLDRYNRRLEELVRAHPDQWMWLHDRWRRVAEAN